MLRRPDVSRSRGSNFVLMANELLAAVRCGDEEQALQLLNGQVNLRDADGHCIFLLAARAGLDRLCLHLLESPGFQGAVERCGPGMTALHVAALHGHASVFYGLVEHPYIEDCQLPDCTGDGRTALHFAAEGGHPGLCAILLEDPMIVVRAARDGRGWSPLHVAADRGHEGVCSTLLSSPHFVDADVADWQGRTALHLAAAAGHVVVCRTLLMHGAFTAVGAPDDLGRTAAFDAAIAGTLQGCQELLAHPRFSPMFAFAQDNLGFTTVDYIQAFEPISGHSTIMEEQVTVVYLPRSAQPA